MPTVIDRPDDVDIRTSRAVYDPGPSGTAVAGLIIGLIAFAVALYAAFAPRETVRRGAEAVETGLEQTVDATRPGDATIPPQTDSRPPSQTGQAQPGWTERASDQMARQIEELREELRQLRQRVDRSEQQADASPGGAGQSDNRRSSPAR